MENNLQHAAIVCVADVFDEIGARLERWEAEKRIGRVSYDEKFQAVCFHFDETNTVERYHIYLRDLETPNRQIEWLNHLRHKNWFTREMFNDLMDVWEVLGLVKQS